MTNLQLRFTYTGDAQSCLTPSNNNLPLPPSGPTIGQADINFRTPSRAVHPAIRRLAQRYRERSSRYVSIEDNISFTYRNLISYKEFKAPITKPLTHEKALDNAQRLTFLLNPISIESKTLISYLIEISKPDMGRRKKISSQFINAMELTVPMLLKAAGEDEGGYVFRSMATSRFNSKTPGNKTVAGMSVGHQPFKAVVDGLQREGFLEVVIGFKKRTASTGVATRFKATDKLIQLAKEHNILPECWSAHFGTALRPVKVSNPIILKSCSSKDWDNQKRESIKQRGEQLPVNYALPTVAADAASVNDLNAYFAPQDIQPAHLFQHFFRVYGEGDGRGADYSKGGRLYAYGIGKSYQNVKKHVRRQMTIRGEPIAEVDLRASYLTILHQKLGFPLPTYDPYDMPGVPRDIVKMWVSMTLGSGKFMTKWPTDIIESYSEDEATKGRNLQHDHPFGVTKRKIITHLPIMAEWGKNPIGWGDLQLIESTAVIDAIKTLAFDHDIPALPIHDALMVQESKAEIAARCLIESFHKHVGIYPYVTISTHKREAMKLAA